MTGGNSQCFASKGEGSRSTCCSAPHRSKSLHGSSSVGELSATHRRSPLFSARELTAAARARPMRPMGRVAVMALLLSVPAFASKPVERTLTGCVLGGAFYSTEDTVAYRLSPRGVDLAPLEGKAVKLRGWLSPGDAFALADGGAPEVLAPSCGERERHLILREQTIRLRVDAGKAAKGGDFAVAVRLIEQAMTLDPPPECDTFTDRATIFAMKGDLDGAVKDVGTLTSRTCRGDTPNPLLLQDLARALRAKRKQAARDVLQLALRVCDGDWCRPSIEKDLKALGK